MDTKNILCIGTLDTKGHEIKYIKDIIESKGHQALVIDCGTLGEPSIVPDIGREEVLKAAGSKMEDLRAAGSAGKASEIMIEGLKETLKDLYESGTVEGVIAIGGGTGSHTAASAMKELPVGVPKVLVSTKVAQAGAQGYVGTRDIMVMPSVADIEGLNRLMKKILANAAGAVCGMAEIQDIVKPVAPDNPLVVMSMVGTTTRCGLEVKAALEEKGYEVVCFHSIGAGGRALEEFVDAEPVVGTIELGINEVGNELFGGLASAGPSRLEAAGAKGVFQIVTPGHSGVIQFLGPDTIPGKYKDRDMIFHNPQATAVLLNHDELTVLAGEIADKLNRAAGIVKVLIPTRGFSAWDKEGERFYNPEKNKAFIRHLEKRLKTPIKIRKIDAHINDRAFSDAITDEFFQCIGLQEKDKISDAVRP